MKEVYAQPGQSDAEVLEQVGSDNSRIESRGSPNWEVVLVHFEKRTTVVVKWSHWMGDRFSFLKVFEALTQTKTDKMVNRQSGKQRNGK